MAEGSTVLIIIIVAIAMIVALIFANKAAADITKIKPNGKSYRSVPQLKTAHKMMTWLSVAVWITIALAITLGILYFIFFGEEAAVISEIESTKSEKKSSGSAFIDITIFLLFGVTLTIGVLGILAAQNLSDAQNNPANNIPDDDTYKKAYHDTIIAASIGVGVVGIIILVYILHAITKRRKKEEEMQLKKEKAQAENRELKQEEEKEKIIQDEAQSLLQEKIAAQANSL